MDILSGEKNKKLIRLAIWFLRKKLGEDAAGGAAVHQDMMHCSNPVFRILTEIINDAASQIKHEEYQRNTVRELSELGLWIVNKDTAYRPVAIWIIKQILNHKEELEEAMKDYYQEPDEWYVNVWSETKEKTAKDRKSGKIPKYAMSEEEEIFTPSVQAKKLKKY